MPRRNRLCYWDMLYASMHSFDPQNGLHISMDDFTSTARDLHNCEELVGDPLPHFSSDVLLNPTALVFALH